MGIIFPFHIKFMDIKQYTCDIEINKEISETLSAKATLDLKNDYLSINILVTNPTNLFHEIARFVIMNEILIASLLFLLLLFFGNHQYNIYDNILLVCIDNSIIYLIISKMALKKYIYSSDIMIYHFYIFMLNYIYVSIYKNV